MIKIETIKNYYSKTKNQNDNDLLKTKLSTNWWDNVKSTALVYKLIFVVVKSTQKPVYCILLNYEDYDLQCWYGYIDEAMAQFYYNL